MWVDPRQLERCWGRPTHPATVEEHDLKVGGEVSYFRTDPGGEESRAGGAWRRSTRRSGSTSQTASPAKTGRRTLRCRPLRCRCDCSSTAAAPEWSSSVRWRVARRRVLRRLALPSPAARRPALVKSLNLDQAPCLVGIAREEGLERSRRIEALEQANREAAMKGAHHRGILARRLSVGAAAELEDRSCGVPMLALRSEAEHGEHLGQCLLGRGCPSTS